MNGWTRTSLLTVLSAASAVAACSQDAGTTPPSSSESAALHGDARRALRRGALYTETDAADANAVLVFDRDREGGLTAAGAFPTGGKGSGAGLGSQGGLARSGDWLFAVDAGSNEITTFSLGSGTPQADLPLVAGDTTLSHEDRGTPEKPLASGRVPGVP